MADTPSCTAEAPAPERPNRLCIGTRGILHPELLALLSAIGAIPAAGLDESGVPGPAWPVLSASGSLERRNTGLRDCRCFVSRSRATDPSGPGLLG